VSVTSKDSSTWLNIASAMVRQIERCYLLHNGEILGYTRAGAIEWISEHRQDEAFFWHGWRWLERHERESNRMAPRPPAAWMVEALKRSASAAAASMTRG
jgi:hypothetical protein